MCKLGLDSCYSVGSETNQSYKAQTGLGYGSIIKFSLLTNFLSDWMVGLAIIADAVMRSQLFFYS